MNDEHDTKELKTVIEPTPDIAEGELMPIEIPPGDDGLRSHVIKLTMRVTLTEAKVESMDAKIASFMTPQQIEAMSQRIADETVGRVEALLNGVTTQFSEIEFSAAQITALDSKLNGIAAQQTQRSTEAAQDRNALNAVVQFINTLAAENVTDPDSKKTGKSWFERMEQQIAQNEERSLSAVVEVSQVRADHVQSMNANAQTAREIKDGLAKIDTELAKIDATNEALNEFKAFAEQIQGVLRAFKHLRENPLQLVALVAAFGTGGYAVPEFVRAIVGLFTGG